MDISQVLARKYPGTEWTLNRDEYAGLTWLSDTPKPKKAELEALWPEVQAATARAEVERARQAAYQQSADPLFFEYQRGDKTEAEWLAAVQAVKDAHPYPKAE